MESKDTTNSESDTQSEQWETHSTQSDSAVKVDSSSDDVVMDDPSATFDEADIQKSEEFKDKGNEYFKMNQFEKSIDMYTEAIFCKIPAAKKSVYFCNRALANLKLENFAVALFDACESVKHDKTNVKGYYRRAQSYYAMRQLKNSMNDFKTVCKMQPQNREARQKFEDTKKEFQYQQLAAAIYQDEKKIVLNTEDMAVESGYSGPHLHSIEELNPTWIQNTMDYFRDQKKLHKKYATMIIQKATEVFEKEETLVHVPLDDLEEITVCGDVHGQFYDLLNIFKLNGNPSESNPYLFNGDFIDRGSFSVEVILTLLMWKICLPQHFYMTRGNHEAAQLNKMYGFFGEVTAKYTKEQYDLFSQLFCQLPLSVVINKKVMVCHGGLFSKDGVTLQDIIKTDRRREPPESGIMCEMLWSDPQDVSGRSPSKRGVGTQFGPDVAARFLEQNNLKMLVRSHECKNDGYEYQKGGKVLTVFSAPNYCDQMGNKGAFVRFLGADMDPKITSFTHVEHPKLPPMAYARMFW